MLVVALAALFVFFVILGRGLRHPMSTKAVFRVEENRRPRSRRRVLRRACLGHRLVAVAVLLV